LGIELQNNQIKHKAFVAFAIFFVILFGGRCGYARQKPVGLELGFRYGAAPALSYRVFPDEKRAFELLFTKTGSSLLFTVLHQHFTPFGPPGVFVHYGYGASIGGRNDRQITALDLQLGACYYLPVAPLNIDFGFRPYAVITGGAGVNAELAVTVRWVF